MIGVAFGGGALLSALLRNKPRRHRGSTRERPRDEKPSDFGANDSRKSNRTSDTWENIKGAVVGVAATRFGSFLEQVVPGFDQEYRKRAGKSLSESAGMSERERQNAGRPEAASSALFQERATCILFRYIPIPTSARIVQRLLLVDTLSPTLHSCGSAVTFACTFYRRRKLLEGRRFDEFHITPLIPGAPSVSLAPVTDTC